MREIDPSEFIGIIEDKPFTALLAITGIIVGVFSLPSWLDYFSQINKFL